MLRSSDEMFSSSSFFFAAKSLKLSLAALVEKNDERRNGPAKRAALVRLRGVPVSCRQSKTDFRSISSTNVPLAVFDELRKCSCAFLVICSKSASADSFFDFRGNSASDRCVQPGIHSFHFVWFRLLTSVRTSRIGS